MLLVIPAIIPVQRIRILTGLSKLPEIQSFFPWLADHTGKEIFILLVSNSGEILFGLRGRLKVGSDFEKQLKFFLIPVRHTYLNKKDKNATGFIYIKNWRNETAFFPIDFYFIFFMQKNQSR